MEMSEMAMESGSSLIFLEEEPQAKQPQQANAIYEFVPSQYRIASHMDIIKGRLQLPAAVARERLPAALGRRASSARKWQTLSHNGPLFAAPYERLPPGVHFYYDNCAMELNERAEEAACCYARLLGTELAQQLRFQQNFFRDFQRQLNVAERRHITDFGRCDFTKLQRHLLTQPRQQLTAAAQQHGYCWLDGQQRRVKNYRLEPPALLLSHNGSMGMLRPRVQPEDVIINCGETAVVPAPPAGHAWQQVLHDHSVSWLCCWYDTATTRMRYMYAERQPAAAQVGRADYETARRLLPRLAGIRQQYRRQWRCENWLKRQLAVAVYCIDRLGMGLSDNGVNLCQLRVEQLTLRARLRQQKNVLLVNWLQARHQYQLDAQVFYCLRSFVAGKQPQELVFEELTPALLQAQLHNIMDGLTPQTFHICHASQLLQQRLTHLTGTECELLLGYNQLLKQLLRLCNHAKPPYKSFTKALLKRADKLPRPDKLKMLQSHSLELVKASLGYMDPRITAAWCLRQQLSLDCIYSSSTLRRKVDSIIQDTTESFRF